MEQITTTNIMMQVDDCNCAEDLIALKTKFPTRVSLTVHVSIDGRNYAQGRDLFIESANQLDKSNCVLTVVPFED